MEDDDLLGGLSPVQVRAVTSTATPLCVLAGAGAGKTRVLTRRIAYRVRRGDADAAHVLALTFTRKAGGELRQRLAQLGLRDRVTAGTFHAVAASQLRRWWADRGVPAPVLLDRKSRVLAPLVASRPGLAGVPLAELAGLLEWAQARLIEPDLLESAARRAGRALPVPAAELAALLRRYQDEKRRRGLIDFDDLLARAADALERDPAFAGSQRWRWRHVFVDEVQDLNPLQHRLLLAWLGPNPDLCIVGDPHQAIYGWNGADPELLHRVTERWPTAEVVRLDTNHRYTRQIVAAAARVLGPAGSHLSSSRPDGSEPDVRPYPTEFAEADAVAQQIAAAHDEGRPWSQLAVLTRTNAQLLTLRDALRLRRVPVQLRGQAGLLDHPAARRALDVLGRAPATPLQLARADLLAAARDPSRSDDDRAALGALADLATEYGDATGESPVGAWLAWLPAGLAGEEKVEGGPAVTLATFHRAKGLEWDDVWVCGLEEGLVPIGRATSAAATAEEQRLLYVALTRARDRLHCSWAERRSFGGRSVPRQPSPWLDAVVPGGRPAGPPPPTAEEWRARLRGQREQLAAGRRPRRTTSLPAWPEADPRVLHALEAWRARTARGSGIPAHVLLHDATLAALAALAPASEEELLGVPGLGPVKAARYGATLLALIAGDAASA